MLSQVSQPATERGDEGQLWPSHCQTRSRATDVIRDAEEPRPDAPRLTFTASEWDAFLRGVAAGEFTRSALAAER